jgi:alpha-L-rhamnosidase
MIVDNGNKFNCGILGIKYAFTVLSEYGYIDLLYKAVTNPEYPSYAWWINNGATALCESWEMKSSNNHHMYSEVDNWMYKYIAGINFTENGVVIRPAKQHFLNEFTARHEDISVLYKDGIYTIETKREVKIVFEDMEVFVGNGTYTYSAEN